MYVSHWGASNASDLRRLGDRGADTTAISTKKLTHLVAWGLFDSTTVKLKDHIM